jgi:uncharacterized protein (TIGR02118 family)
MELVGAFSDRDTATRIAGELKGTLLCDEREDTSHLPFAALVTGSTDDLPHLLDAADVGVYLVCRREIKQKVRSETHGRLSGVIGVFTLIANPEMGHQGADQHWRDNHAPLALDVHTAMSNYNQLSIVYRFSGPQWDGFALCGFDTIEDLRTRFFNSKEGEAAIAKDVARFSDRKSPRRIIAVETRF